MAQTVHLYLKANGADIKGESTVESLGRKDSIECIAYDQAVNTAREAATGMVTGRRQYGPLAIRKRIDKASPLLVKALTNNEAIEGVFKFFRPNPTGDGTEQHFFTVEIKNGHVSAIKQALPNTITRETSGEPPQEEVSFVFRDITWTYEDGGITHSDSWGGGK